MSMHEDGGCRIAAVVVRRRGELVVVVVVVVMASGWRRRTLNNGRVSLLPPCEIAYSRTWLSVNPHRPRPEPLARAPSPYRAAVPFTPSRVERRRRHPCPSRRGQL